MEFWNKIKRAEEKELISAILQGRRGSRLQEYLDTIYKYKFGKGAAAKVRRMFDKEREKYKEWFEWSQCENPDYNKYYVKLVEDVKRNIDEYQKLYNILSDDASCRVLINILKWRISLKSSRLVEAFYESSNKQYFEPFEYLSSDEIYVDCGGYIGDTVRGLMDYRGGGKEGLFVRG